MHPIEFVSGRRCVSILWIVNGSAEQCSSRIAVITSGINSHIASTRKSLMPLPQIYMAYIQSSVSRPTVNSITCYINWALTPLMAAQLQRNILCAAGPTHVAPLPAIRLCQNSVDPSLPLPDRGSKAGWEPLDYLDCQHWPWLCLEIQPRFIQKNSNTVKNTWLL